jgi:hypothetical protein
MALQGIISGLNDGQEMSGSGTADLLERIMAFEPDAEGAQLPFISRLARE